MRMAVMFGCLAIVATPTANAATVLADASTQTLACGGEAAVVEGSRNTVSFTGDCRALTVRGDANAVNVELGVKAELDVQGTGNRIRYSFSAAHKLRISGNDTELTLSAPSEGSAVAIALTGDGETLDLACGGRSVVIKGNRSTYTLRGGCRSISASGDGNRIRAELLADAHATVEGNDSTLAYFVLGAGEPALTVRGLHSRANRLAFGLPAPAALVVAGSPPPAAVSLLDDAVPLPPPVTAATAAAAPLPIISAPRLPVLVHALGARVVAEGTQVSTPANDLFLTGSDSLRQGAEPRLREVVQLATLIHTSAVRVTTSEPADDALAVRRGARLQAWFVASGYPAESIQTITADEAEVAILLAR
jgi:Protein of unknown function (DUF3060)